VNIRAADRAISELVIQKYRYASAIFRKTVRFQESGRDRHFPSLSLKVLLALVISLLAFSLTGIVTLAVGGAGIRGVEQGIGNSLTLLADQMQDKLDRSLFERFREIGNTARLVRRFDAASNLDRLRAWLEELRGAGEDYAWIAFVNKDGRVVAATGRQREGEDVSRDQWFRSALQTPMIGAVRDDGLSEKAAPAADGPGSGRVLDIALPVADSEGKVSGILAAQINWSWADEIRDSVTGTLKGDQGEDLLVLSSAGEVILGPSEMLGKTLHLASKEAPMMQQGVFEGQHYLFAYAKTDGYRNFGGLGWSVLVRQDAKIALAPVRKLQNQMIVWGLGLSLLAALAAWAVAARIAAPLLRLASAARNIRQGADIQMPELHSYAEAEVLSRSFASLVVDLKQRESAVARLNETLESQVADRTRELAIRNAALVRAYADAETATRAKSRFLAAASHDLRQPLHAMTLFARALSRRTQGEEAPRLVAQIEEALKSLKGMFDALLNVSRLDAGLIQPNPSHVSVSALVDGVSAGFRLEAEGRGLRFLSRSVDAHIYTDPALIETMLRNLVSNAMKFVQSGGVALTARRTRSAIVFQIFDTGPGINEDRRERIFDEFERAKEQAHGQNEGLGLGLSIVRRYAALLGIEIELSSRLGHGSCFSLVVPALLISDVQPGGERQNGLNGPCTLPAGLRVLVLDDDPMIVAALTHDLSDRGCAPRGATTPPEAEAILASGFGADAFVMDFELGGPETGLDFLARMEAKLFRKIPGLILTGGTDAATLATVIASGRSWLTKPADPDIVAAAIAGIVARGEIEVHDP
jgi:signal transduction histidine kinase/ActR/RegA family two-component response regulator